MQLGKKKFKKYKIKKDYQTKNLQNPFFRSHKNNNRPRKISLPFYFIGFLLIILAIFYVVLLSPFLQIKQIKVVGLVRLPQDMVSNYLWSQTNNKSVWPLNQKNLLMFDGEGAELNLMTNFNFSKIKVNKKLFNTLSVEIEERPYAFIWQEAGKSYYSDSKGFIIKDNEVLTEDFKKFPVIENSTPEPLISNDYIKIDQEDLTFIFNLKSFSENNPEILIDKFLISQDLNTIHVIFQNGLLAYFNTKEDLSKQIDKLLIVKKEKIKDNLSKVNYVDLRYGDKVYIGNK